MLRELSATRQIPGENPRRWFTSAEMDLIVWFDSAGKPDHFELCFDKSSLEQCLRWSHQGHHFFQVDSGENEPGRYKATPIHRDRDTFNSGILHERFLAESAFLPGQLQAFIAAALVSL